MEHSIPKQFSDPEFGKAFKDTMGNTQKGVEGSLIMTIFTNLVLAGSITLIWSFVNALQMLMFLAMCQINFPSTVKMLYQILLPLSSLDIIPQELSSDLIFSFSDDQDYAFNQRLEELGFDSHNMILNLGSMFYYINVSIILLVMATILTRIKSKHKLLLKLKKNLKFFVLLNQLFIVFQEGFIEILVSCYLNFQNTITITVSDKVSNIFAIILIIVSLTVIPAAVIFAMSKDETTLNSKKSHFRYGAAYENLKTKSVFALFYNLLFLLRRLILVFFIFNKFLMNYNSL